MLFATIGQILYVSTHNIDASSSFTRSNEITNTRKTEKKKNEKDSRTNIMSYEKCASARDTLWRLFMGRRHIYPIDIYIIIYLVVGAMRFLSVNVIQQSQQSKANKTFQLERATTTPAATSTTACTFPFVVALAEYASEPYTHCIHSAKWIKHKYCRRRCLYHPIYLQRITFIHICGWYILLTWRKRFTY